MIMYAKDLSALAVVMPNNEVEDGRSRSIIPFNIDLI